MEVEEKDIDWLFKQYSDFFEVFAMEKQNVIDVFHEWKADEGDTVVKYLWVILEKLLYEAYIGISDVERKFKVLSLIFKEMWKYKIKYEGEKANDIYKKYLYCQLKSFQMALANVEFEVQLVAVRCCPYCDTLNNKKVSIEEALEMQYLPSHYCTNEVICSCYYKVEFHRDQSLMI